MEIPQLLPERCLPFRKEDAQMTQQATETEGKGDKLSMKKAMCAFCLDS